MNRYRWPRAGVDMNLLPPHSPNTPASAKIDGRIVKDKSVDLVFSGMLGERTMRRRQRLFWNSSNLVQRYTPKGLHVRNWEQRGRHRRPVCPSIRSSGVGIMCISVV